MDKNNKKLTPTIGLEIHVELKTESKMFCSCVNYHFNVKPNTHTCPVCLGLPGALPIPNRKAVEWTILIGLALGSEINKESKFDRKHYFYPDLPKGYQISQYDEPFCFGGKQTTSQGEVNITRVHLEEDTGKLLHKRIDGQNLTLVDFNRSGVPLVEIVTEPDIKSGAQAKEFAQKLQNILRYLNVSDCDMEKGSMRLEANISLGLDLGYKVEVKNLNSFRFVEKAIDYELDRQKKIILEGKTPKQETRGWNESQNKTISQRYKETAADYRYFPEPDIPPMRFTDELIGSLKKSLPELPEAMAQRFKRQYSLKDSYAKILTNDQKLAQYAERSFKLGQKLQVDLNDIAGEIVNRSASRVNLKPDELVEMVSKRKSEKITDEGTILSWIKEAVSESPDVVSDYQKGKTAAISVLIGAVMRKSQGKADASKVKSLLMQAIANG